MEHTERPRAMRSRDDYIINFVAISIDVGLYFRNRRLDQAAELAEKKS